MKPRMRPRLPTSSPRLRGPGAGSVALYCDTAPQSAIRPPLVERVDRGLELRPADVVEVDVDAVGRRLAQRGADVVGWEKAASKPSSSRT